jgi:hypothetical protein
MSYAILAIVNFIISVKAWVDSPAIIGFTAGFAIGARIVDLRRIEQLKSSKEKSVQNNLKD